MTDLDRLFREYHQPLVRYLTRRLGDRDWAEEVTQETFLRAARQETRAMLDFIDALLGLYAGP